MEFFDPHFHIWAPSTLGGPHEPPLVQKAYLQTDYEKDVTETNCADKVVKRHTGGVFIEAFPINRNGLDEAKWVDSQLKDTQEKKYKMVVHVNLADPSVDAHLAQHVKNPRVTGVRQVMDIYPGVDPALFESGVAGQGEGREYLTNEQWQKGFYRLAHYGLSFDLQINPQQFEQAARVIRQAPDTIPVILDHFGFSKQADVESGYFIRELRKLAALPNVYLKLSMMWYQDRSHKEGSQRWDINEKFLSTVHEAIEMFGAARCMFATNYPVDKWQDDWSADKMYAAFQQIASKYSPYSQELLWHKTAKSVYVDRPRCFVTRPGVTGEGCIVTGCSQGIGLAIATEFARCGARVLMADINETKGKEAAACVAAATRNPDVAFCHVDVTDEASVAAMVQTCVDKFKNIRILVNNAVRFRFGHLKDSSGSGWETDRTVTSDDWQVVMDTNVRGYANCIRHAGKAMKNNSDPTVRRIWSDQGQGVQDLEAGSRGSIVNVGSIRSGHPSSWRIFVLPNNFTCFSLRPLIFDPSTLPGALPSELQIHKDTVSGQTWFPFSGWIAQPEFVPYNCSKAAIIALTRCCALDFASDKIRVNCVAPSTVDTPGSYAHMKMINLTVKEGQEKFGNNTFLKRQAAPDEIGTASVFLASDDASYVTGEVLVVGGGQTV